MRSCYPSRHWCSTGRRLWRVYTGSTKGPAPAKRALLGARRITNATRFDITDYADDAVEYIVDHLTDAELWRLTAHVTPHPPLTGFNLVSATMALDQRNFTRVWGQVIRPDPFARKK